MLNPGSFAFFAKIIQEKELIREQPSLSIQKMIRVLYDLMLTLAFGYCD